MRPRVALLTAVEFWWHAGGNHVAIVALIRELVQRVELNVVVPLALDPRVQQRLQQLVPGLLVHSLQLPPTGDRRVALAAFADFFRRWPQDACIIEYLSMAWMRAAVPPKVLTLLDTHDVASEYQAGLAAMGALDRPPISAAEERRQLEAFDHVMAISRPDAEVFSAWLGAERVVLVPPGRVVDALPLPPRGPGRTPRVLFVGSPAKPNADGLSWLLREVWPRLREQALILDVVGKVGAALAPAEAERVVLHGHIGNLRAAYAAADVCINPVRYGSGLKIKSVEALSYARPLVTTWHGARGLEPYAARAYLATSDPDAFAAAVREVLNDEALATRLAAGAVELVRREFSAPGCYAPLLRVLGADIGGTA